MATQTADVRQGGGSGNAAPWQLRMFSKSIKKQQKVALILSQLGDLSGKRCLLVTHGDNNGAMNVRFREAGGTWTWVENEEDHIPEMQALLGDPVLHGSPQRIPAEDGAFDVAISIDTHEHLADCRPFNRELRRVVRPGGTVVVSTPTGEAWKPVTVVKHLVGMTKEKYGHHVIGYSIEQHQAMLREVGLEPQEAGTYSKFFSESVELLVNFAYVMVLSRKKQGPAVKQGTIAPSSAEQLRAVEKQYRIWAAAYPFFKAVSSLDALLFFFRGYAVSVTARKPEGA